MTRADYTVDRRDKARKLWLDAKTPAQEKARHVLWMGWSRAAHIYTMAEELGFGVYVRIGVKT
jgi:hypothetical protein